MSAIDESLSSEVTNETSAEDKVGAAEVFEILPFLVANLILANAGIAALSITLIASGRFGADADVIFAVLVCWSFLNFYLGAYANGMFQYIESEKRRLNLRILQFNAAPISSIVFLIAIFSTIVLGTSFAITTYSEASQNQISIDEPR